MKKIKCFLFVLASLFYIDTYSQSVKWADETENNSKITVSDLAGYTNKSVFVIKKRADNGFSAEKFFLDRYDLPDMKKVWTKEIWGTEDGTDKGKTLRINNVYSLIDGVIVIALNHDYSTVYAMQLRTEDGVLLDSKKVTIGDMDAKNSEQAKNAPFKFCISKDGSTLLGYYVSRHSPVIHTIALDANLNIKWKKDIMPSFSNNDFNIDEVCTLDGNEIGLLASIRNKGNDQKYRYVTVYYNHTNDSKFETRMDLGGDKLIDGINFDMDANGNPVAAGMYKNDGKNGLYGSFGFRIDAATGKVLATASTEFTKEFLTNFISERKADKGKGVPELQVDEIYMTADNDIIVAAERYYVVEHTSGGMNGGFTSTTYVYHYDDIVLAKLDGKSCKTEWAVIIPKKQISVNNFKASYGFTIQANTIYLAFCDNRKNADMDPKVFTEDAEKLKTADLDDNGKYLVTAVCTVDAGSGNNSRKYVTNYKEDDSKLVFSALSLTTLPNNKGIFVYRGDKKTDQGGVLTLH
ncbi:MAG TPA: hypothetical protein VK809_00845 [Bacteroidia bacterium]|jgi:hypothetical protein|nr:hypothetical protein [Bacteroidia bacterium]